MQMNNNDTKHDFVELKNLARDIKLLYVEDHEGLRQKATGFFKQFFTNVTTAQDGLEGLDLFHKFRHSIVVTGLKMPKMNGLQMARKIHELSPTTKVILTSAYDDSKNLHEAINAGVFRFIKKPLSPDTLTKALLDALHEIKLSNEQKLFDYYIQTIFNFQHNLLILYRKDKPVIVNDTFLDFFQVDDLANFKDKYGAIGNYFLKHKNFLYNTEARDWYEEAINNLNKLYHVKMMGQDNEFHHFVFRMKKIDSADSYYLASFDDITDLGLLRLFDDKQTNLDEIKANQKTFINLFQSIQRNHTEIKLLNFYKGLSVTNKGVIVQADENHIIIQTNYLQQRCAHYEGKMIISNSLFPADVLAQTITNVNYEEQSITIANLKFLQTSPTQRQSIRLVPEDGHRVSLFYEHHKFGDHIKILDISMNAVRLSLLSLPAGFQVEEKVFLDMVFNVGRLPLIINSEGHVLYIREEDHEYQVVIMLHLNNTTQKKLIDYLSKRQMALIREFKGLQYGK